MTSRRRERGSNRGHSMIFFSTPPGGRRVAACRARRWPSASLFLPPRQLFLCTLQGPRGPLPPEGGRSLIDPSTMASTGPLEGAISLIPVRACVRNFFCLARRGGPLRSRRPRRPPSLRAPPALSSSSLHTTHNTNKPRTHILNIPIHPPPFEGPRTPRHRVLRRPHKAKTDQGPQSPSLESAPFWARAAPRTPV